MMRAHGTIIEAEAFTWSQLPPEIEASRPSPPYRKNLCDWIILSAAKFAGLDDIDSTSLPPVLKDYIKSEICDAACFWNCVAYYSDLPEKEVDLLTS